MIISFLIRRSAILAELFYVMETKFPNYIKNGRYPMHDTCLSYKFSAGTQCI